MDVLCCDLEVDVNGEGVFMVDKKLMCQYSGRLRRLFGKSLTEKNLKVIFHDFPGGAEIFELVARFCYNNGNIELCSGTLGFLHSAAVFMEMSESVSENENLTEQLERSFDEINYWTWSDLLLVLKQKQHLSVELHNCGVVQKCLDVLVGRLAETSSCPSTSSPDSSGCRISCDTRSTESMKTGCSRATWWFEDLSMLNQSVIKLAVKSMVLQKLEHGTISKFLFHYQKSKFVHAHHEDKCRILEMVITILHSLDHWSISYKSLMGILRVSLSLNISKGTRRMLEAIIGLRIDEAKLDDLLIPSPSGVNYLYDVNLVLRLLTSFLSGAHANVSPSRLVKVSYLLDMYLAEIAPDPCLKPSKFIALATMLPDTSRDSYDELYHAIDMYLEVHADVSEEEAFKICSALNYEKLSPEACLQLSKNKKFPSRSVVQTLLSQQAKLKDLLIDGNYSQSSSSSPFSSHAYGDKDEIGDQIDLCAEKLDILSENEKLRDHLQGMQCRVTELEKVCQKMQAQMAKMMKSKSPNSLNGRSLPKLCS